MIRLLRYIIKIHYGSEELLTRHGLGYVCTVTLTLEIRPWVKVMTPLGHGQQFNEIIIQIQHGSKELWPRHGFWVCVHCDLDI